MKPIKTPVKIDALMSAYQIVEGDFDDLSKFDFEGVYIIYRDDTQDVVYIGSAYTRTVEKRLKQYISVSDTGNTLMHAICKIDYKVSKVKEITNEQKLLAVQKIKTFKIKAIPHRDLEYQLIRDAFPVYNTVGYDANYYEDWF